MKMSGILIADDAKGWFESGMVRDVTIRGNRFIECGDPVIAIKPEAVPAPPDYVHANIRILDNTFILSGRLAISALSTRGLTATGNIFITKPPATPEDLVRITSCADVTLSGNRVDRAYPANLDYGTLLRQLGQ